MTQDSWTEWGPEKAKWNEWSVLTRIDQKPLVLPSMRKIFLKGDLPQVDETQNEYDELWKMILKLDCLNQAPSLLFHFIPQRKKNDNAKVWALGLIWVQICSVSTIGYIIK